MEKLLFIDCCIRREESRTKVAADYLLKQLAATKLFSVEKLCLMDEPLHYLSEGFFQQRERYLEQGLLSQRRFDYAHQFATADLIVIAAPFWDLTFPALLKTYIENVSLDGISFYSDVDGCHGMCKARQLIFLTTRGGYYEGSKLEMGSRYMKALTEFFAIDKYSCLAAEGLDIEGNDVAKIMSDFKYRIDDFITNKDYL